jgi:uncharacterized membrane protein YeaQ/YmgE (transglycosylase-associated protein family)
MGVRDMIWSMIVGVLIGAVAGAITNRGENKGCFFKMFAGLIGSSVGQALLGSWGPSLAGMALIPSIVGAIIVIALVEFVFGKNR